jgi:hypothetical protein
MRTKNFIKTVKKLISSFFNLPQNSNIEDLTQSDGPLVPIVHYRMTFGEPPSPPVETVGSQPIVSRVWLNGAEVNIEDLDPNIYTQLVGRFVRSSIPSIEVTVEGLLLPPISPTYTGMRPPVLLTASQAEQIVEMGADLENVIIADRLPPIPESCQVPSISMPCSRYYIDLFSPSRLFAGLADYTYTVGLDEQDIKMYNCPYFANSPHLKCTANPENTNCLECNEY